MSSLSDEEERQFLEYIVDKLIRFSGGSLSKEEAFGKVSQVKQGKLIASGELIFHETPEYWALVIFHGRRDFWNRD